jgi:formyltetrahydrofolate synthetase
VSANVYLFFGLVLTRLSYSTDSEAELKLVADFALRAGADQAVPSNHWGKGGEGAVPLAQAVIKACEGESEFEFLYDVNKPLAEKIEIIAKEMYGADGIELSDEAKQQIETYTRQGESPVGFAASHSANPSTFRLRSSPHLYGQDRSVVV